jgi:hypothetical protein
MMVVAAPGPTAGQQAWPWPCASVIREQLHLVANISIARNGSEVGMELRRRAIVA